MIDIPATLRRAFDGDRLEAKTDVAAILATVDDQGLPHLSFLSAGEVVAKGDTVALMLWARAHSAAAIERQRRATLYAAGDGIVHEVRLEVAAIERSPDEATMIVLARADALREHKAPYASVEALIAFRLADVAGSVARWQSQVGALRAALAQLPDIAAE